MNLGDLSLPEFLSVLVAAEVVLAIAWYSLFLATSYLK